MQKIIHCMVEVSVELDVWTTYIEDMYHISEVM